MIGIVPCALTYFSDHKKCRKMNSNDLNTTRDSQRGEKKREKK